MKNSKTGMWTYFKRGVVYSIIMGVISILEVLIVGVTTIISLINMNFASVGFAIVVLIAFAIINTILSGWVQTFTVNAVK
jgi:predicted ABC-type exoprotein transport system permease subunit